MTTLRTRLTRTVRSNLPPQRMSIESNLTRDEVIRRLRGATDERRSPFGRGQTDKWFRGVVGDPDFQLVRVIADMNSFLPTIEGRVESHGVGSRLTATLRLNGFTAAFMLFWFGFLTLFTVALAVVVLSSSDNALILLVPLGFYGFGFGLVMVGFGPEARRGRTLLEAVATGNTAPAASEDWFGSGTIGWRDVRSGGWLGYVTVLSYPVAAGLALYTWFDRPGCTRQEALDPRIYCPAGWRTVSVWVIFAGVIGAAAVGSAALRRRRRFVVALALGYNIAAVAALLWILDNPAFFPHHR